MVLTISIIAYLIIAVLVYFFYFGKDESHTTFEKIWLSFFWIFLPVLWVIHKLFGRDT